MVSLVLVHIAKKLVVPRVLSEVRCPVCPPEMAPIETAFGQSLSNSPAS